MLADLFAHGELRDPDVSGHSLTVTEVRVSPDLKHATALVAPLGGGDVAKVLAGLKRASGFLRREVAHRVRLRFMPELAFEADAAFDRADRIDHLLHGLGTGAPGGDHDGT